MGGVMKGHRIAKAAYVVGETEERTTSGPSATMYALAAPSQGSAELSSWRVEMAEGQSGPVHSIDREQVWMPLSGVFEVELDGAETLRAGEGQALVLPAGVTRQVSVAQGTACALVCMSVDGRARAKGGVDAVPLPWAR